MPNWVENLLTIKNATPERIEEIRSKIAGMEHNIDENGRKTVIIQRAIDFHKICPVPNTLEIEDSSLGDEGYDILNKIMTYEESMDPENAPDLEQKFREYWIESQKENIQKAFRLGKKYYLNFKEYGCKTSIDWCYDNWGTKWNSHMAISVSKREIFFLTANQPPFGIIMLLGADFKDAHFELSYSSESNKAGIFSVHGINETHNYSDNPPDKFDNIRKKLRQLKHTFEKFPN